VILAVPLLAIGVACALGARRAGAIGIAAAALVCAACVVIMVATMAEPRLRRPDYRAIAETLGHPAPSVGVFTPYHGTEPLARYMPGAVVTPPEGVAVQELELVQPLGRSDGDDPERPQTPLAPAGFVFIEREEHPTFTRVRYRAREPVAVTSAGLAPLAPATPTFPPALMVWPAG
jgi:hypothetical protein